MKLLRVCATCLALIVPGISGASSRTEPPEPDEHVVVCGKDFLYLKNFNQIFSAGSREARLKAVASLTVRHPKAEPAGVKTKLHLRFRTEDFLSSVNQLFALHEYNGCDRLNYNHDAALQTVGDSWLIIGNFNYEERICTSLGSSTVFNTTQQVRIKVTPQLEIVNNGNSAKLVTSMKTTYEVPVFLLFSINGSLFEFETKEYKLPDAFASNLESSEFSLRNSDKNIFADTYVTLRPLPAGVSCFFTKKMGEKLWESGDWGRAFGGD